MINFNLLDGFDWDKGNWSKNQIKHAVFPKECEEIFLNQPIITFVDIKHSLLEKRFYALGITDTERKLSTSFTLRKNKIRIISARDMSKKEQKIYEEKSRSTEKNS